MKNFFLAVTSFLATVILLSQVALAQEAGWYTDVVNAAPGDEPKINTDAARSNGKKGYTEGASPDSADDSLCMTCKQHRTDVKRRGDYTTSPAKGSGGSGSGNGSSSQGQEGSQ